MLMQANPALLAQLAGGHRSMLRELKKMERMKEIKVCYHMKIAQHYLPS